MQPPAQLWDLHLSSFHFLRIINRSIKLNTFVALFIVLSDTASQQSQMSMWLYDPKICFWAQCGYQFGVNLMFLISPANISYEMSAKTDIKSLFMSCKFFVQVKNDVNFKIFCVNNKHFKKWDIQSDSTKKLSRYYIWPLFSLQNWIVITQTVSLKITYWSNKHPSRKDLFL